MAITKATSNAVAPAAKGDLVVGSATNDSDVLAVGSTDQVLTVDSSTATGLKWSTPVTGSITWTQRKFINTSEVGYNAMAYNGSNLYVAAGNAGVMASSTDGITWTDRTSGFGANTIRYVAYGNGLFVAVGDNGTITTSTDGTTWTARTANMSTNRIWSVTYANSLWVAVGAGGGTTNTGGIIYSSDGITWTRKSQSVAVGVTYYDVVWNGTNWVITASSNGTNNMLYASTPSGTWTVVAFVSGATTLNRLFYDGTRTIVANDDGYWYFTTSATMASPLKYLLPSCQSNYSKRNAYYNGKIYMVNGAYYQTFTPSSQQGVDVSLPQIAPSTLDASAGLNATTGGVFVFSTGTFLFSDTGAIWTSF